MACYLGRAYSSMLAAEEAHDSVCNPIVCLCLFVD